MTTSGTVEPVVPEHLHVSVAISARYQHITQKTAFGIATDIGYTHTAVVPGSDPTAALLAAFEHVLTDPVFACGVDLYCADEHFVNQVLPLAAAWPHLTIHPWSPTRSASVLHRAAYKAASAAVSPETLSTLPQRRLLAATDGSTGNTRLGEISGYGWITENGRFGSGFVPGDILVAEITAISRLLDGTPPAVPLHVLVDSQAALGVVEALRKAEQHFDVSFSGSRRHHVMVRTLHKHLTSRDVTFAWVRGHSGNVLNEAADSLARQARRCVQYGTPGETQQQVDRRIVADAMAALATEVARSA